MYVACTGEDLHKVLWLKSRSSEVWLERRTHYTRSCAVMSMVGLSFQVYCCCSLQGLLLHIPQRTLYPTCCWPVFKGN